MSIGSNIKLARKLNKMTQKELATKINKAESSVKKYESDQINIPLQVLNDISDAFGIDVETLVGNEDNLERGVLSEIQSREMREHCTPDESDFDFDEFKKSNDIETLSIYKYLIHNKFDNNTTLSDLMSFREICRKVISEESNYPSISAFYELLIYANNNESVNLTNQEQETLFNEIIDYIRYKLYSMGK